MSCYVVLEHSRGKIYKDPRVCMFAIASDALINLLNGYYFKFNLKKIFILRV